MDPEVNPKNAFDLHKRRHECLQSLFDLDMILSDAMVKFPMPHHKRVGASRISSWHEYGVAAKDLSVIHAPAQRILRVSRICTL
jgi:hypothetical protein